MQQYGGGRETSAKERRCMAKYKVDIEGQIYSWDRDSISLPELRELAGYAADQEMKVACKRG
jgi:hypothetical protein